MTDAFDAAGAEAFGERMLGAVRGMLDIHTVYIGDRLGLYTALAASAPATPAELAAATATDEAGGAGCVSRRATQPTLASTAAMTS
jgi:hypothetical protein